MHSALPSETSTTDIPEVLAFSLRPVWRVQRRVSLKPVIMLLRLFFIHARWYPRGLIIRWFVDSNEKIGKIL